MSTLTRHVILNSLDAPLKILIWTKVEICMFLTPIIGGLLFKHTFLGLCVSFLNYKVCKAYHRRFGKDQFQAVCYWFLPHSRHRLPVIPASYVREYIG